MWQRPVALPVEPYAMHHQLEEGPSREGGRGEVDRTGGSTKREREGDIDLEGLVEWRPRDQEGEGWRPLKRLRLDSGLMGERAEGYSIPGHGVAGEAAVGPGWWRGRGLGIEGQHRTRHSTGQGIVGEAVLEGWRRERGLGVDSTAQGVVEEIGARWQGDRGLWTERQGRTGDRDRTGIG